jgi:hypothetical protein
MTARIIKLNGSDHDAIRALLPWYANETLEEDEHREVRKHLVDCHACQDEVESHLRMMTGGYQAADNAHVDEAWTRFQAQLLPTPRSTRNKSVRWIPLALAAQLVLVSGGLYVLHAESGRQSYTFHALAAPHANARHLVIVVTPDTAERELSGLLRDVGAHIVDGPSATDAFVLEVDKGREANALRRLRANTHVALVQALDSETGQ